MFPYSLEDIEKAYEKNGFKVIRGMTFEYDSKDRIVGCCPLGSLLSAKYNIKTRGGVEEHYDTIKGLGLTYDKRDGFIAGYDGNGDGDLDLYDEKTFKEAYRFGKKVFKALKKKLW